jgi:hypothetical protein
MPLCSDSRGGPFAASRSILRTSRSFDVCIIVVRIVILPFSAIRRDDAQSFLGGPTRFEKKAGLNLDVKKKWKRSSTL